MAYDVYYTATSAIVKERLGELASSFGKVIAYVADLEFDNEHGHQLAPVKNALVVVQDGRAFFQKEPGELLSEDADEQTVNKFCELADNCPSYLVYNGEELAKMLE
jgi:hypothetical protein